MQTRRDAAISKGAGSSQGENSSAVTESGKNPVRIEKSSSTSEESEENDKYDVAMDAELGCMVVNGDRSQPPTRYRYICWKPTHISPDCLLISDEEREAIAKRREAALADRSRVVRFRPSPAWITRDKQQHLIQQGEKPHLRFGERHNVGMDKKLAMGLALPVNNSSVDLSGPVLSSSPSSPASLSPTSTSLGHDHVISSDEVPLFSLLSSGIYQVDALLATPKAKEFVQTLVAMDICCGLDLIREDMVPKDAIKQYVADTPRVRDANGCLANLSAGVSLEVPIADQVFKRTLLVAP
jgi:hypothetical protein